MNQQNDNNRDGHDNRDDDDKNHVLVAVLTPSGSWPASGHERVPPHQKVKVAIDKAIRALGIVDTSGWIATVGNNEINLDASYADNGLAGTVDIHFFKREGGGGS